MTTRPKAPHLRAVERKPDELPQEPVQGSLFRGPRPRLVAIVDGSSVTVSQFLAALREVHPRSIFDVRPVPAFEQWGTSRAVVFGEMEKVGCRYYDLAPVLKIASSREARFASGALAQEIGARYLKPKGVEGPIFIVVANADAAEAVSKTVPLYLRPAPREGWEVEYVPAAAVKHGAGHPWRR